MDEHLSSLSEFSLYGRSGLRNSLFFLNSIAPRGDQAVRFERGITHQSRNLWKVFEKLEVPWWQGGGDASKAMLEVFLVCTSKGPV